MKKRFFWVVKIIACISVVLLNLAAVKAGVPVVHISPKPDWLSTCKPYDKRPSLRTIEGGYFLNWWNIRYR